jgi:hypothetical protein
VRLKKGLQFFTEKAQRKKSANSSNAIIIDPNPM